MWWENPPQTLSAIVTSINIKHWHPAWTMEIRVQTHRTLFYAMLNGGIKKFQSYSNTECKEVISYCDEGKKKNEWKWGVFVRWAEEKCNSTNNDNKWIVEFLFFENTFFFIYSFSFFFFASFIFVAFRFWLRFCSAWVVNRTPARGSAVLALVLRNINKVEPFLCQ